jgi:adenylate cyclase, class 2
LIEVEVKAGVKDFLLVEEKLNQIGAVKIKTEHQMDVYFNAPHKDFGVTDEALRIREIPEKGGKRIILTYKGAKMDDVSKTRKEIEVDISESHNMALILENLGFRPAAKVIKDRVIYNFQNFIITLDTVHDVGTFVEIEKEALEGQDHSGILKDIFDIYLKLGIDEGFERRSYLEIMGVQ